MIRLYIYVAAFTVALSAFWYVQSLRSSVAVLRAENASLARSVAVLEGAKAQAAEARAVEAARAERWKSRAETLGGQIETIIKGEFGDAMLDPALADLLNSVRAEDGN